MERIVMLKPGDRFGDYTVVRLLGQGGMGSVFLLENAEGGQVAAKILDPASADDHESRKRFLREAELALGVKHPNLVETHDVGEDPDTGLCYILMEYVPGGSLADRLKAGPLPVNDAIRIVYQIASVLELARQKGIVHRDIKPDNIMFGADGTPKLADLGIARGGVDGASVTTVTQTGMMIGTPAYMAPEQMLDAHNVDSRADIYSLGIVFYEMLVGQRPHPDDTVVQLMAKAVAGEPVPDVRTLRPEVSASLAELVSLMCAMKVDDRVATPAEVTTALSQIVHGREVTIRRKAPKAIVPEKRRLSVRKVLPWAMVTAGVAGFAAFAYFGRPTAAVRPTAAQPAADRGQTVEPEPAVAKPRDADSTPTSLPDRGAVGKRRQTLEAARSQLKPISVKIAAGRTMEFMPCPAGTFKMGFEDRTGLHGPHEVTITRPYWIAKYPVTFADWRVLTGEDRFDRALRHLPQKAHRLMEAYGGVDIPLGRLGPADAARLLAELNRRFAGSLPAGCVFRLPTMAEWEHAFKCGDERLDRVDFARTLPRRLLDEAVSDGAKLEALRKVGMNVEAARDGKVLVDGRYDKDLDHFFHFLPMRIGTRPANAWGVFDMANAAALTLDRWCAEKSFEELRRENRDFVNAIRLKIKMQDGARDPLHWDVRTPHVFVWSRAAAPWNDRPDESWLAPVSVGNWSVRSCMRPVIGPDLLKERGIAPDEPSPQKPPPKRKVRRVPPQDGNSYVLSPEISMEMVGCPPGTFTMGYDYAPSEATMSAVHEVTITRPFWIGKHPVTREQWATLMGEVRTSPVEEALGGMKAPVSEVTDGAIRQFCWRLTARFRNDLPPGYVFRLPTDAEWEYALRGGTDDPDDPHVDGRVSSEYRSLFAVLRVDKEARLAEKGFPLDRVPKDWRWFVGTHEVCTKRPNAWGLYDMLGNVDERVLDRFPIENPDGTCKKSGEFARVAEAYAARETDPLRWHDKPDAIGLIRTVIESGRPERRRFYSLTSRSKPVGFRLVVAPVDFNGGKTVLPSKAPLSESAPTEVRGKEANRPNGPQLALDRNIPALGSKTFVLPRRRELELVGCPAGTFRMGSAWAPPATISHLHEVTITRPFWIGKHPVTREQWTVLMGDLRLDAVDEALGGKKAPVTKVSADDVREFCQKLMRRLKSRLPKGYVFRLPTDAEWEYAMHGGSVDPNDPYAVGVMVPELLGKFAVTAAEKRQRLGKAGIRVTPGRRDDLVGAFEVCTKPPNGWGIYDLVGNVDEWLLDTFPVEAPDGKLRRTGDGVGRFGAYRPQETDPLRRRAQSDAIGMVRSGVGGKFDFRRYVSLSTRFYIVGFRVVLGPDLEKERSNAGKKKAR